MQPKHVAAAALVGRDSFRSPDKALQRVRSLGGTRVAAMSASTPEVDDSINVEWRGIQDGRMSVHATMLVDAPDHVIYDVLRDHEKSHEIYRNVKAATVATEGDVIVVKQLCSWQLLFIKGVFEMELEVSENHQPCKQLSFTLKRPGFMKSLDAHWQVQHRDDGTSFVSHTLSMQPSRPVPFFLHSRTAAMLRRQIDGTCRDVRAEVLRRLGGEL